MDKNEELVMFMFLYHFSGTV